MRLLYPSDPIDKKRPDEAYEEEYSAASGAGLNCALLSSEDFELGEFKTRPNLEEGESVLYRGWMLNIDNYSRLVKSIENKGAKPVTSVEQYRLCHHLPQWYPTCAEFTPETIVLSRDADFSFALANVKWPGYFVKDYVKSLNTGRGSLAQSPDEVSEIVSLIEKYRGNVEGGVVFEKRKVSCRNRRSAISFATVLLLLGRVTCLRWFNRALTESTVLSSQLMSRKTLAASYAWSSSATVRFRIERNGLYRDSWKYLKLQG